VVEQVNLNHNAGVPVNPRVLDAMMPYFHEYFGNPSSVHSVGQQAAKAIENARMQLAQFIGATTDDRVVFTSGATEANNLALIGYALRNRSRGTHIITSQVEHLSIINTAKFLVKQGFTVTQIPVDPQGVVSVHALQEAVTKDTILISIQHANNEVGTIQPLREIARIANDAKIPLHVDAVASAGQLLVKLHEQGISLLTLSSNDLYGPKGVGALVIGEGVSMQPIIMGGGQELGLRSGSENVPGIVGMGAAASFAARELASNIRHLTSLRDRLIRGVLGKIDHAYLNGHPTRRLPNNANIRFSFVEGEGITLYLSFQGFLVATSSACTSKTLSPSHVLLAMGIEEAEAHGALQLTLGVDNTVTQVDRFIEVLPPIIARLRAMSPLTNASPEDLKGDECSHVQ
jgi:cysteine desulfurase